MEITYLDKVVHDIDVKVINNQVIRMNCNKIPKNKIKNNDIIIASPFFLLWDYFLYDFYDDDMIFEQFFDKYFDKIKNVNWNDSFFIDDYLLEDKYIVKNVDYWKLNKDQILEVKLTDEDPPFALFYSADMIKKITEHYKFDFKIPYVNTIKIPHDFDLKVYRLIKSYDDKNFLNFNEEETLEYYLEKEESKDEYKFNNIPEDFDPEIFRLLNKPLKLKTNRDAFLYFENNLDKNLQYKFNNIPKFFDMNAFKAFNQKFRKFTDNETLLWIDRHQELFKNMKYQFENVPYNFSPEYYYENNSDIKKKMEYDKYTMYLHYENKGFFEGRNICKR